MLLATVVATAAVLASASVFAADAPAAAPAAPAAPSPAAPAAPAPAAAPAAPAAPAKLTGMAAWAAVVGNTVQGKVNGKDYFEFYEQDGKVKALTGGTDLETGKWALEGTKVCVIFPGEDKECYVIEVIGEIVNFTDDHGKGVRWTLLKGNPKSL
jgi:hypothetical protein